MNIDQLRKLINENRNLFDFVGTIIVVLNNNGRVEFINKRGCKILGYTYEELIKSDWFKIVVSPEIYPQIIKDFRKIMENEMEGVEYYQNEIITRSGDRRMIAWHNTNLRDSEEKIIATFSSGEDITELINAQNILQKEKDLLNLIVETSPTGITLVDKEGNIIFANSEAENILGINKNQIKKRVYNDPSWEIESIDGSPFPENNLPFNIVKNTLKPVYNVKHAIKFPDSRRVLLSINSSPMLTENGEFDGIVCSIQDITSKYILEQEIAKNKRIESIGLLAGGIAHDFNNILTNIVGNLSLAKSKLKGSDSKILDIINASEQASMQATSLTQQLLTFSKGGTPILKPTSIESIIKDTTKFILRGKKINCHFHFEPKLWKVNADYGQISQVLNNLILNAEQSMPNGGKITINAHNVSGSEKPSVPLNPQQKYVEIKIIDEGCGIHPDNISKIFDPFFSTKSNGSGLGLSICYSIVTNHNGFIIVDSELSKGSTFTFYLPATMENDSLQEISEIKPIKKEGIALLMDDNSFILDILSEMLLEFEISSYSALDGEKLLDLFESSSKTKDIILIVLDMTIPGGKGGMEIIKELRGKAPDIPIIMSSGYSTEAFLGDYKELGFSAILRKPYRIEDLAELLTLLGLI
jgi:PAS domain S-box-containing protein